jgi:hypothetical protein
MIVSQQQRKNLFTYLDDIFTYREPLTEVYDHVLTAAENYEGELPYQELITHIIQYEFGGSQKLVELEKSYKKTAVDTLEKQLWYIFRKNMINYGAVLTIIAAFAVFYLKLNLINAPAIAIILICFFLISIAQYFYLPFKAGYQGYGKKESLKDKILTNLLNFPNRIWGVSAGIFFSKLHYVQSSVLLSSASIFILYIALPVFIYSYYEAFKNDYKLKANFINPQ